MGVELDDAQVREDPAEFGYDGRGDGVFAADGKLLPAGGMVGAGGFADEVERSFGRAPLQRQVARVVHCDIRHVAFLVRAERLDVLRSDPCADRAEPGPGDVCAGAVERDADQGHGGLFRIRFGEVEVHVGSCRKCRGARLTVKSQLLG